LVQVTDRNTRSSLRLGTTAAAAGMPKGRISSLLRKAGSAVKQGGNNLVASIQRLGTSQGEELQLAG
jgi:hypothetical protein